MRARLVLSPQVCPSPALTAAKLPVGGLAWPKRLLPQQVSLPFAFTPQVWTAPASTLPARTPAGAAAIEAPASPVGGAAARAVPTPARLARTAIAALAAKAARRHPNTTDFRPPLVARSRTRSQRPPAS